MTCLLFLQRCLFVFFYINFSIITDRIFISKLIPSVESTVKD